MRSRWFIVIESLGAFWVDCEGKAFGPYETAASAAVAAKRLALEFVDDGRTPQVFASGDGAPQLVWTGPSPGSADD